MEDDPSTRRPMSPFGSKPVLRFRQEADRRTFVKGAALVGVGVTYVAVTRGDPVAFAQGSATDLEILNYALTLEYLEAEFYTMGVAAGILTGRDLELVTPIRDHEQEHVTAVTQTIQAMGGTPVEKPGFVFPDGTFTDRDRFLTAASMFEELGVTAYHGQIANVQSPDVLGAAAAIAGVESRHAAIVADLIGGNPFPAPFEANKTMEQVLDLAGSFIQQ